MILKNKDKQRNTFIKDTLQDVHEYHTKIIIHTFFDGF